MSWSLAQQIHLQTNRSEKILSAIDEMSWGGDVEFFMESGRSQTQDALMARFSEPL